MFKCQFLYGILFDIANLSRKLGNLNLSMQKNNQY